MARVAALAACSSVLAAQAISNNGKNFLASALQPDIAAKSLVAMEDEWQAEAGIYADCQARGTTEATKECVEAGKHFKSSCNKVVVSILQGSSGRKDAVNQFMDEVCNQDVMQDWHKDRCLGFAGQVSSLMSADSYENRNALQTTDFCSKMWEGIVSSEKERAQKEADDEAERAKNEAKLAEEKAEEQKKQQAEAEAKAKAAAEAVEKKVKADEATAKAAEKVEEQKVEKVEKVEEKPAPATPAVKLVAQVPAQAPVPVVPANNTNSTKK